MFEDLIPSPPAEAAAPPPGMFDDLIPAGGAAEAAAGGMFDDLIPASGVPSTVARGENTGPSQPRDAGQNAQTDGPGAVSGAPRFVGEAFGAGPVLDLLDPGVLERGWEGTKQGFGSQPLGFSDENRRKYPVARFAQPFVAPIDAALRLPGAIAGGAAGLGAGMYRAHGGGKAESDRLERDLNILGQGALIESGMGPAHTSTVLDNLGRRDADIGNLPWDPVKQPAKSDIDGPPPTSLSAASPDFRAGVLRIAGKALEAARGSLRDMFEGVRLAPPKEHSVIDLGFITPEGAAHLNTLFRGAGVDLDVSGFRHTVDTYAARHVFKEHGDSEIEGQRGQAALTSDDWAMIPDVLAAPDHIAYLGRTDLGRDGIGYWKRIDGHIIYVEEVRTGRQTLAAVTMQKFKGGTSGVSGVPGRPDGLAPPRSTADTDPGK
jgi:phage-Barnase-EndoU-ColicinE5/D-RelE like nuclease3